jgi:hypothetical protein
MILHQPESASGESLSAVSTNAETPRAASQWCPDDELGIMPMSTSTGYSSNSIDAHNDDSPTSGVGAQTAASLVAGAKGFLEGFRQMAMGDTGAGGSAHAPSERDVDVEDGIVGESDDDEWEDEESHEYEQDDMSSRVSSTVSSDEDSDGGTARRRSKKKARRKARGKARRGSTASSAGSAGSFVSSVTSVSSVSSEGLRRAFEESLEQAMRAAADADEANAERRRLADEYLDVALYIYDQVRLHGARQAVARARS